MPLTVLIFVSIMVASACTTDTPPAMKSSGGSRSIPRSTEDDPGVPRLVGQFDATATNEQMSSVIGTIGHDRNTLGRFSLLGLDKTSRHFTVYFRRDAPDADVMFMKDYIERTGLFERIDMT